MSLIRVVFVVLLIPCIGWSQGNADSSLLSKDIRRVKLHEDIDLLQQSVTNTDFQSLDALQKWIEENTELDHRSKIKYLSGIKYLLEDIVNQLLPNNSSIQLLLAYKQLMEADIKNIPIDGVVEKFSYSINHSLLNERTVFYENTGLKKARVFNYTQYISLYPEKILTTITPYLNEWFVDGALIIAAKKNPTEFYNYAAASEKPLAARMRKVKDPMVELLCKLSSDSSGRLLFPFIHPLLEKELTYDSIKSISQDGRRFFQLLVKTQVHYQSEIQKGNPPIANKEIFKLMKRKAEEVFINEINALHDEPDEQRFKIVSGLNATEMYYLMVCTEDIIYTSSFVGLFNRMMQQLQKHTTDELLVEVYFDGFRKFIKMSADYNKLDEFMQAMRVGQAELLLKDFVARLESDPTLEDAVDVANAFSSIGNPLFKKRIMKEVDSNLMVVQRLHNDFGIRIYEALQLLLKAEKDSGKAFAKRYELAVPYFLSKQLLIPEGKLVEQLFFYGDKDGIQSFQNFLSFYKRSKVWKVIKTDEWVEIKSLHGVPISIFANIPFDNSNGEDPDTRAQSSLNNYLLDKGLQPTIAVHRGHSYHLKSTLLQLPSTAKIVLLGSCGSYQYLNAVLEVCPTAHIISSREVGSLSVNDPILNTINERIRLGREIDWVSIWKTLSLQLNRGATKNRFDNYVAPHKNLGSMLLQAFNE